MSLYPANTPIIHPFGRLRVISPLDGSVLAENFVEPVSVHDLGLSPDGLTLYTEVLGGLGGGSKLTAYQVEDPALPFITSHDFGANHLPSNPTTDAAGNIYVLLTVIIGVPAEWHLIKLDAAFNVLYDKQPFVTADPLGHRDSMEVSADGTRLYWSEFNNAATLGTLHAYDLVGDVALPDLATTVDGRFLSLKRDPLSTDIYALDVPNAGDATIKRYTTAGAEVLSYTKASIEERLCPSPDGLTIWTLGTAPGLDVLTRFLVADGSQVVQYTDGVTGYGTYGLVVIAGDVPGTIIVNKVTVPPANPTNFPFVASGGLDPPTFTLQDGGSEVFADIPAEEGAYGIEETPVPAGWSVSYVVSNGSPVDAISVDGGEVVTVTVTNTEDTPPAPEAPCAIWSLLGLDIAYQVLPGLQRGDPD